MIIEPGTGIDEPRGWGAHCGREAATTGAMADAGLDFMLVHGVGALGQFGEVAYLTGWVPDNKGIYTLARRGKPPLIFATGPHQAAAIARTPELDAISCVVARSGSPAAVAAAVAAHTGDGRVGISSSVPAETAQHLRGLLGARHHPSGTDLVDQLRLTLAAADREAMRGTAQTVDEALLRFRQVAEPGMTEVQAAAEVEAHLMRCGSVVRIVQVAAEHFHGQRPGTHRFSSGEVITVFAESSGPSGHWIEVGAMFQLGEVDQTRQVISQLTVDLIRAAVPRFCAGIAVSELARDLDDQLVDVGRPTIGWGHGVGIDDASWLVSADSRRTLTTTDAVAVHPSVELADAPHLAVAAACTITLEDGWPLPLSELPFNIQQIPLS